MKEFVMPSHLVVRTMGGLVAGFGTGYFVYYNLDLVVGVVTGVVIFLLIMGLSLYSMSKAGALKSDVLKRLDGQQILYIHIGSMQNAAYQYGILAILPDRISFFLCLNGTQSKFLKEETFLRQEVSVMKKGSTLRVKRGAGFTNFKVNKMGQVLSILEQARYQIDRK